MSEQQLTGRANVSLGSKAWRSAPGASCMLPGVSRAEVETDQGTAYSEKLIAGKINATFKFAKGDSLVELRDLPPLTVTFTCDTGQVFIFSEAVRMGDPPQLKADGGDVEMEFMSNDAEEVKSA